MPQGLINEVIDEKRISVKFKNHLLCEIEEVSSSPQHVMKMKEFMLENRDFIAPVSTIVKIETKKPVDVD